MDDYALPALIQQQAESCLASLEPCEEGSSACINQKVRASFAVHLINNNLHYHLDRIKWDDATLSGISDVYVMQVMQCSLDDGATVSRLARNDDRAWLEVELKILRQLRSKAYDMLSKDPVKRDDLVQEVDKALVKALKTYPYDQPFDEWLSILIRNTVSNARRSAANRWDSRSISINQPFLSMTESELSLLDIIHDPWWETQRVTAELMAFVEESKSLLSDAEYQVLQLEIAGYKTKEIAALMNKKTGTIYQMRQKIHRVLRDAWHEDRDEGYRI